MKFKILQFIVLFAGCLGLMCICFPEYACLLSSRQKYQPLVHTIKGSTSSLITRMDTLSYGQEIQVDL